MQPPIAKKIPTERKSTYYQAIDDYAWMEDKERSDPTVLDYLKAENAYTEEIMSSTKNLQEELYQEMCARIKEDDQEVPYRLRDYWYYRRTEADKQYSVYCRKKDEEGSLEEVLLDMNKLAEGKKFISLGDYEVSDDGNWLAFTTDTLGFRQYDLHVQNLVTGEVEESIAHRVDSVAWDSDNATLYYTEEHELTKRSEGLFAIRRDGTDKTLVYREDDELYHVRVSRTRSGGYVVLLIESSTTTEVRYKKAGLDKGFQILFPRVDRREYTLDHRGDEFLIRINDTGKNFRVVSVSSDRPLLEEAHEKIPHRQDIMIEDVDCFEDFFVVTERERGLTRYQVYTYTGESQSIEFEESVYSTFAENNYEFVTNSFRYNYESFITPDSVYDYDVTTQASTLLKQLPVLGGYTSKEYETVRVFAKASDGTEVPISLVYKKETQEGSRPLYLNGYGSYGIANDVYFSSNLISLLNRGVMFGIAHIRGGGELGESWHEEGKLMVKKNTFTDFIACADFLVESGYTTREKMVVTGRSAGGLLMGAVANMRPDLCRAFVFGVPFVDMMNTMLDTSLPLTVGEYLEWGNPNEEEACRYMQSYSPYDNIEAKNYPAMLVWTSLYDSQVMYWEPAKYVAKLRALKTDRNTVLFKTKLEPSGHGGASGRYDRLRDLAFEYAYILNQIG
ncbi:MAG: S9 family peptidase [Candidatus Moranbacteria bacterium]|nr:S9 family peptidase [Candidatus Moranbacteria bacterium]